MKSITDKNSCYVCKHPIQWQGHIPNPSSTEKKIDGSKVQADLVAVRRISTTIGPSIEFEVTVTCPHCKNKNKFFQTVSV